jgi:curved DNA-binding protein
MQNFRDYYEILGISKEATADEIKRAYRALARQYHPDLNPGDKGAEEKFKLLGEAYDVLSDVDKRSQYEEYSRYWNQKGFKAWGNRGNRSKRPRSTSQQEAEYSAFEDFDNFVEQLLKRHKDNDAAVPWQTVQPQRANSDGEAFQGNRKTFQGNRINRSGSSNGPSNGPSNGSSRNGSASEVSDRSSARAAERASDGKAFQENRTRAAEPAAAIPNSRRAAYQAQPPSRSRRDAEADLTVPLEKAYAGGRERIRLEDGRSLEVNMPPGMVTGQRIRLKGQGIDGGNLYLRIEVEPHPYFTLQSGDVYCRLPVTPSEAVLGGMIAVPTLGGAINMMIPPGVQFGQKLRLTGKGYPISPELYGDQIVEIEVVLPTALDDEEKALYQELREIERFDPRANLPVNLAG